MKNWLKQRPCLSIRCLEREAGLPTKTLSHWLNGRRELTEHHKSKLIPVLKHYGFGKADEGGKEN